MKDNLLELYEKFSLDINPKYAGGSVYRCGKCSSLAHSMEGFFPCQDGFVPMKVVCSECGQRWVLEIRNTDSDPPQVLH